VTDTLDADFYARPVLHVARDLIGCTIEHEGSTGVIVETEAYHDSEPACHAFIGLTQRTRTLFGPPGRAYVYRSYGIHALLNAVCEPAGVGAAVLIRALEPVAGIEAMSARRAGNGSAPVRERDLCSGPGKLTQALGVSLADNDTSLQSGPIRVGPREGKWLAPSVVAGSRIGISRAVELQWRFSAAGNPYVSRPRPPAGATVGCGAGRGN
jgi:DNA-3-methyladenine glycosylase